MSGIVLSTIVVLHWKMNIFQPATLIEPNLFCSQPIKIEPIEPHLGGGALLGIAYNGGIVSAFCRHWSDLLPLWDTGRNGVSPSQWLLVGVDEHDNSGIGRGAADHGLGRLRLAHWPRTLSLRHHWQHAHGHSIGHGLWCGQELLARAPNEPRHWQILVNLSVECHFKKNNPGYFLD